MNPRIKFPSGTTQKIHFNMINSINLDTAIIKVYISKYNDNKAITCIVDNDIIVTQNIVTVTIQADKTVDLSGTYEMQLEITGNGQVVKSDRLPFAIEKSIEPCL